jgi:uncharacterized repeat protein (TIGR01451 family)
MNVRSLHSALSLLAVGSLAVLLCAAPVGATISGSGPNDVVLAVPATPEGAPDVNLTIDDGSSEDFIGDGGQFIWINRFTPAPGDFPFALTEVQAVFGTTMVTVGGAIDIVFHEDTDGDNDPGTGAVFLDSFSSTVQVADGATFNVYAIDPPVTFCGPGDVLVGVINRYGFEGFNDFPAGLDQTATQGRSWAATYLSGNAPAQPSYPADEQWGTIDSFGFPGNWVVRAFGSTSAVEADLALTKTAVATDTQIVYTLTVTNVASLCGATGVVVTDDLPADTTYVSDDCGGVNGTPWTWIVGNLSTNASATCNITVDINPGAPVPIINTAVASGDQTDPVPDNDVATSVVGAEPIVAIPTLDVVGLGILFALLTCAAFFLLRRRRA